MCSVTSEPNPIYRHYCHARDRLGRGRGGVGPEAENKQCWSWPAATNTDTKTRGDPYLEPRPGWTEVRATPVRPNKEGRAGLD